MLNAEEVLTFELDHSALDNYMAILIQSKDLTIYHIDFEHNQVLCQIKNVQSPMTHSIFNQSSSIPFFKQVQLKQLIQ